MIDTDIDENTAEGIIKKCQRFLKRSSDRFNADVDEQERALEIAGGKFWNDKMKKRWSIVDDKDNDLIPAISYNNISPQVNSIASPFCRSPFHINIINKEGQQKELQQKISRVEGSNNTKMVYQEAMTRGVTCSAGYVVIGTSYDRGALTPNIEFVSNQKMVAIDPDCITPSCEDAEEGALVSYIGVNKARREFGEDVIPFDYPKNQPKMSFHGIDAWSDREDQVQLVRYFCKDLEILRDDRGEVIFDEEGNPVKGKRTIVNMYTICGDKVVAGPIEFDTDIIPIVRFAGYNDYDSEKGQVFTGYVQRMGTHIEQMSLALTMQAVRMRQCSNVRIVIGKSAAEGCEGYISDFEKRSSIAVVFNDKNGASPPQIVNDSFQTSDISAVLQEGRQTMQECSGMNLAGINTTERTAYEIMQQQVNSESNVQELYLHAEAACHTIGKILLGILNNGIVPEFTLEGGPSVITSQMKERAEIQAIASMVSPEHQELLAIRIADTITSDVGKALSNDLKANCGLQLSEGQDVGTLMNACEKMKKQLEDTMQQLQSATQENDELNKQVYELQLQISNNKAAMDLDERKFEAQMAKDEAQLAIENAEAAKKLAQEDDRIALNARRGAEEARQKNAKLFIDAMKARRGSRQ